MSEKEISLAELKITFSKDLDPQNKMIALLELTIGKNTARTDTAGEGDNKERRWNNTLSLQYSQETSINITIYDQSNPQKQVIGTASLQIMLLKLPNGQLPDTPLALKGETVGTITGRYTIKDKQEPKKTIEDTKPLENLDLQLKPQAKVSLQSLNKSARSRQTILPQLISTHVNYGDQIFDKQSAATLQKTILVYSMPKGPRFINGPKYSGEPSYCVDSCFKLNPSKGAGFGYGRKKQFPDWLERNMKENPPPGAYLDTNGVLRSKGPTFGISHKHYEKVLIGKQSRRQNSLPRKLSPIRQDKK